jgi:hypothetical protein
MLDMEKNTNQTSVIIQEIESKLEQLKSEKSKLLDELIGSTPEK